MTRTAPGAVAFGAAIRTPSFAIIAVYAPAKRAAHREVERAIAAVGGAVRRAVSPPMHPT